MPPSGTSSYYIYGVTLTIAFDPKVIVCLTNDANSTLAAVSLKINGAWKTIYKMGGAALSAVNTSGTYTVTDNGDGTYTVPTCITTSSTSIDVRWFAIG